MPMVVKFWGGDEWEEHILQLLRRHYGPSFQEIPATDKGDCGIEGFANSDGCAYQCYAAEDPLSTSELYEKQRDKISRDIKKFIGNRERLAAVLGTSRVSNWVFLVPRFESARLIAHAQTKAAEVRAAGLPYASAEFIITIQSDEVFAVERQALLDSGLATIDMLPSEVSETETTTWAGTNDQLISNLNTKVAKMQHLTTTRRGRLSAKLLKDFIAGRNLLQYLREQHFQTFQKIHQIKNGEERFLENLSLTAAESPRESMDTVRQAYLAHLQAEARGLSENVLQTLSWEAIADWMLRCPLDFEGAE